MECLLKMSKNPVAKFMNKFNKAKVVPNKKKQQRIEPTIKEYIKDQMDEIFSPKNLLPKEVYEQARAEGRYLEDEETHKK